MSNDQIERNLKKKETSKKKYSQSRLTRLIYNMRLREKNFLKKRT